jgi:uncharacterized membrane protein
VLDRCVRCSRFTIVCSYCGVGSLLMLIFIVWLAAADWIYVATFGNKPVASAADFLGVVFTTSLGWKLIVLGNGIGFLFALLVRPISAVSFRL